MKSKISRIKEPTVTVVVAESPKQQEKAAVRDEIIVDRPGERAIGESEVAADSRKRHINDGRADQNHQHAKVDDQQCNPAKGLAATVT